MITWIFVCLSFLLGASSIVLGFKGRSDLIPVMVALTTLSVLFAGIFAINQSFWVKFGRAIGKGWGYVAPRAQVLGVQVANRAGHVAHRAGNGFQGKPWFWSGVMSAVVGIFFLLGAGWYENWGAFWFSVVLLAISAACFINYYDRWSDIGKGLAKAADFLGKYALEFGGWAIAKFFKYPLYIITTILIVIFISSHYFDWSSGDKWLWGILAFVFTWASVVTARGKWPEFWKITFGSPRPILISTGISLFLIGFFTKAFVPGGLGDLLATFGICLVLIGTVGVAVWGKVAK